MQSANFLLNVNLKLRKATLGDAKLLFDWVNDEDVRSNSINQESIDWETHLIWLKEKLSVSNSNIFILLNNDVPLGQIRIELIDEYWMIDYSIDKFHRGMGWGRNIIALLLKEYPSYKFKAIVKKDNAVSRRIFEKIGFRNRLSTESSLCEYYSD